MQRCIFIMERLLKSVPPGYTSKLMKLYLCLAEGYITNSEAWIIHKKREQILFSDCSHFWLTQSLQNSAAGLHYRFRLSAFWTNFPGSPGFQDIRILLFMLIMAPASKVPRIPAEIIEISIFLLLLLSLISGRHLNVASGGDEIVSSLLSVFQAVFCLTHLYTQRCPGLAAEFRNFNSAGRFFR